MTNVPHNPLEGERPELSLNLQNSTEEQVSIVIVHKDRPEYLNICLQSIAVTSMNNNYEIIVSDNNSGQDSQDFLNDIKDEVTIVRNKENLFWSGAANRGAEKANKSSKYLIFMHCDVVITNPAWIDLLINVSESSNSGLVGLELQSYYMQNQKINFIQEWCVLVTRDCWEKCGPFDERLPFVGSPFILTINAQNKGFKPQVMKNPIAHHYKIFSLDINEYERIIEKAMVTIPQIMREAQSDPV
jgi:glycosyltransferase involved in cell wall biosynthesis